MNPAERRQVDRLVGLLRRQGLLGRIRPVQITAINATDPPTVDVQIVGSTEVLTARRFAQGVPLAVSSFAWAWQEERDLFLLGGLTSVANSGWRYVGAADQPAFANDWANYDPAWQTAGFRRLGDVVELRGMVRSNGAGAVTASTIFTLPVGSRPRFRDAWPTYGGISITVWPTGAVQYEGANNPAYVGLSTVRFSVS